MRGRGRPRAKIERNREKEAGIYEEKEGVAYSIVYGKRAGDKESVRLEGLSRKGLVYISKIEQQAEASLVGAHGQRTAAAGLDGRD